MKTYEKVFYGVSAPAGSGKTEAAINHIVDCASQGYLFIFAVPSLKKTQEVYDRLILKRKELKGSRPMNDYDLFSIKRVTSDEKCFNNISIEEAITKTMTTLYNDKTQYLRGGVIVVTHEGLLTSTNISKQDNKPFHLIWDEATSVIFHRDTAGNDKQLRSVILDNFLVFEEHTGENGKQYFTIEVSKESIPLLEERIKGHSASWLAGANKVLELNKFLLHTAQGFCEIAISGVPDNPGSVVFFYNHLRFYGYRDVTFLGANLEMTTLYRWFEKSGVEWKEHPDRRFHNLDKSKHQFRLNIYYGSKNHEHTKSFLETKNNKGVSYKEMFVDAASEIIEKLPHDEKILTLTNKRDDEKYSYSEKYILCPRNLEGLNEYRKLKNVMMLGSFNNETPYYTLLAKIGMVDYSASLKLYQLLMRLECREWDFRGTINLFLPCLDLFEPIKHLFNERMISYISLGLEFENCEDGRRNTTILTKEWYLIENKEKMRSSYGFPLKNKNEYIVWFEKFGYKTSIIEVRYKSGHNKMRKYQIVYKSDKDLEDAKSHFNSVM